MKQKLTWTKFLNLKTQMNKETKEEKNEEENQRDLEEPEQIEVSQRA